MSRSPPTKEMLMATNKRVQKGRSRVRFAAPRSPETSTIVPSFDGEPLENVPQAISSNNAIVPGSDGEPPSPSEVAAHATLFRGELSRENGVVFISSGGIRVRVTTAATDAAINPAADATTFAAARGPISIRGNQRDGTIYSAALANVAGARIAAAHDDAKLAEVAALAESHREELMRYPGAVSVRAGYRFRDGWITDEPAVVVSVMKKNDRGALPVGSALPQKIGPYAVDVAPATPLEQLLAIDRDTAMRVISSSNSAREEFLLTSATEEAAELAEAARTDSYKPPNDVSLDEVNDVMTVLCHTSPDAGWPTLEK